MSRAIGTMTHLGKMRLSTFIRLAALAACTLAMSCVPTDEVVWIGFSPSDRYLASVTRDGTLCILDTQTHESRKVSTEAANGGFEWAPDGDRLAFCTRRNGQWDLALAEPGGRIVRLTRDEWRDFQPTWSPDGRGLYYASSRDGGDRGDYDIRYYDLSTRRSFSLISGPHDQVEPRVSPDGRWLATISYQQGNPLIRVHAVKTMRVIQIPPPPNLRSARLRSPVWLGDSRRLLCPIENEQGHHLAVCEVEEETWKILESSRQPFESLARDRNGRDVLYVSGGEAYRYRVDARWRPKRRLAFDGFPVTRVAVRHGDDRLGAVVGGSLLATASASGGDLSPLVGDEREYLLWGDLALQRGRTRDAFRYYETAFARLRVEAGPEAGAAVARAKLDRAPLLCRLGYSRAASSYLREAHEVLENSLDDDARRRLHVLFALNEYVWNNRTDAARVWLDEVTSQALPGATDDASLLLAVVNHPSQHVRKAIRRGLRAFWRGTVHKGVDTFVRLLESHPADPVVQAVCRRAWLDRFAWLPESVSEPALTAESRGRALAQMAARSHAIAGEHFEMDRPWFDTLAAALLTLREADGLRRLGLQHGLQLLDREEVLGLYRRCRRPGEPEGERDPAAEETLAVALFHPEVVAAVEKAFTRPEDHSDVRLAVARWALVSGEYDQMKRVLDELARELERRGEAAVFGSGGERAVAYAILQGELAERQGAWDRAVVRYREAAGRIERVLKAPGSDSAAAARWAALLGEARFRAGLLQRGAAVRDELQELLTIERAVGDYLMIYSTDPTSLVNGIHNYFALLTRVRTPWIKDLVYLRAGQSFRRLGRWGEAGFCLRVAAQSKQSFVANRAQAELVDHFTDLEDPGLARWHAR